jgi:hypothetical protein
MLQLNQSHRAKNVSRYTLNRGLTQPGLETTIYRTRAGSPNHYTTNMVGPILKDDLFFIFIYAKIYI